MSKKSTTKHDSPAEEIASLIEAISKKGTAASGLEALTPEQEARLSVLVAINKQDQVDRAAFKKRGYKYGTVEESWEALRSIAKATKLGKYPPVDALHWLTAACERTKTNDEMQLVRELGLLVRGRRLTVNPQSVAELVQKFIDSGNSIMEACEQASQKMGCTMKTAHRWYKATLGAETDGRRR